MIDMRIVPVGIVVQFERYEVPPNLAICTANLYICALTFDHCDVKISVPIVIAAQLWTVDVLTD